jgi:phosphoglycolate phosphatase-like HAD superfamily hydrolase
MIGDHRVDIETGKNAGCRTVLVLTGKGRETREKLAGTNIQPDLITGNIFTAIEKITQG